MLTSLRDDAAASKGGAHGLAAKTHPGVQYFAHSKTQK